MVRHLSLALLLVGALFIILGAMVPVVLLTGRLPVPYALSTRLVLSVLGLSFGLLLGLGCIALSRTLLLLRELEHHTRCAMNLWLILEERDFGETGGEPPEGEETRAPPQE